MSHVRKYHDTNIIQKYLWPIERRSQMLPTIKPLINVWFATRQCTKYLTVSLNIFRILNPTLTGLLTLSIDAARFC
jgi:hypothetical protein